MAILIIKAVTGDKILSLIPLQENMNHKVCILQSCNPIHGVPSKSSSMKLKRKNKVKKEMVFQFSLYCYQLREVTPKTVLRGPRIPIAWLEFSHWKRPMSWISLPDCSWELNLFSEFLINYGVSFHKRKMRLASSSWNSLLVSSFSMCKFLHYSYNCICSVLVFPVVILHYKKCWRKKKKSGGEKKSPKSKDIRAAAPLYMGRTWPGAQAAGLSWNVLSTAVGTGIKPSLLQQGKMPEVLLMGVLRTCLIKQLLASKLQFHGVW